MLTVRSLTKTFSTKGRTVQAVQGLSFEVQPGEVYALLGPNGAGKTTTLRMIATLLRPDAGTLQVHQIDAIATPRKARTQLAYVPAEAGLQPKLTPREVVTLFATLQGVPSPGAAATSLLEALGAATYQDTPCGDLSTGMKRRVVLARALVHDPQVLLLDEPTDGLDVQGRRDILGRVRTLAARGKTVVLSSHILSEVEAVAHRIGIVSGGQLQCEGTLPEILAAAQTGTLEDAFIHFTGTGVP